MLHVFVPKTLKDAVRGRSPSVVCSELHLYSELAKNNVWKTVGVRSEVNRYLEMIQQYSDEFTFNFDGIAFVLKGEARPKKQSSWDYRGDFTFLTELYVDGIKTETVKLPANYLLRRNELFWKYQLPGGAHTVKIKLLNPSADYELRMTEAIVYSEPIITK